MTNEHSATFFLTTMCRQTSNGEPLKLAKHKQKSADSPSVSEGKQARRDLQADPLLQTTLDIKGKLYIIPPG